MPALPSSVIEPVWDQFALLIPEHIDTHALGCHYPRIPDRTVFDELVQVFTQLEQLWLEAYDKSVGLHLSEVIVDGCIVKAPCGGEAAGRSPARIARTHRCCDPLWSTSAGSIRAWASVCPTTSQHLDAGYDSAKTRDLLDELGCDDVISQKVERTNSWHNRGFRKLAICPERRARVINAFIALASAVIVIRRLLTEASTTHRWDDRPPRRP